MPETTWTTLPPLDGRVSPCGCCPPIQATLPMEAGIAVGFGDAHVERDGVEVYREPGAYAGTTPCDACDTTGRLGTPDVPVDAPVKEYIRAALALPTCPTCKGDGRVPDETAPTPEWWDVADAERVAAADPDHDWRIVLFGPLHGEVYQRQGDAQWVLVEKNNGFA